MEIRKEITTFWRYYPTVSQEVFITEIDYSPPAPSPPLRKREKNNSNVTIPYSKVYKKKELI